MSFSITTLFRSEMFLKKLLLPFILRVITKHIHVPSLKSNDGSPVPDYQRSVGPSHRCHRLRALYPWYPAANLVTEVMNYFVNYSVAGLAVRMVRHWSSEIYLGLPLVSPQTSLTLCGSLRVGTLQRLCEKNIGSMSTPGFCKLMLRVLIKYHVRPICYVFERARTPRHFLLIKGHPMRKL